jgi:DNA primase
MDPKEQIKRRVNLKELIGEYLELKPSGTTGYKAICPFHQEKTPSFHVSEDKNIWHCFGCGEGGDAFSFLMKMEGMDFPEALRHLGKRVGVEIKRFDSEKSNKRQRMIEINELAEKFFRKVLMDSSRAEAARGYLMDRGIGEDLQQRFGIGYAPDSWEALVKFLRKRGFKEKEGVEAGVFLEKRSSAGVIDRFRDRVMIPIRNRHGDTVGFTGRIMPGNDDEQAPKYMNSPETPVYHKSQILFGLDVAKQEMKREGYGVIVEGNLDVVASHKAGVENVVASSGTALTKDQVELLKRYTETLVFAFDSDAAGFDAARKGMRIARKAGCDVRVAELPPEAGKDPDDAVQKDPQIWIKAVENTIPSMQYFIDKATEGKDLKDVDDKRAVSKILLPEIAAMPEVVERDHWIQEVADLLQTNADALRRTIDKKMGKKQEKRRPRRSGHRRAGRRGAQSQKQQQPSRDKEGGKSREERTAIELLGFFIQQPKMRERIAENLDPDWVPGDLLKRLYKATVFTYYQKHSNDPSATDLFAEIKSQITEQQQGSTEADLKSLLGLAAMRGEQNAENIPSVEQSDYVAQLIDILKQSFVRKKRQRIESEIRRAEKVGNTEKVKQLVQKFNKLQS